MTSVIGLSNDHEVEIILFNGICKALKNVAAIIKIKNDKKYFENIWVGLIAIRKLWIKSAFPKYEMESDYCDLLSKFFLCNNDGHITENVRNVVLSLCYEKNGNVFMKIPPINDESDPIPAEETLDLGPMPDFVHNKNPR